MGSDRERRFWRGSLGNTNPLTVIREPPEAGECAISFGQVPGKGKEPSLGESEGMSGRGDGRLASGLMHIVLWARLSAVMTDGRGKSRGEKRVNLEGER